MIRDTVFLYLFVFEINNTSNWHKLSHKLCYFLALKPRLKCFSSLVETRVASSEDIAKKFLYLLKCVNEDHGYREITVPSFLYLN